MPVVTVFSIYKNKVHYPARTSAILRTLEQKTWNGTMPEIPGWLVAMHIPHGKLLLWGMPPGSAICFCHRFKAVTVTHILAIVEWWLTPAQILLGSQGWTVVCRKPPSLTSLACFICVKTLLPWGLCKVFFTFNSVMILLNISIQGGEKGTGSNLLTGTRFLSGEWKCSKIRLWWWLHSEHIKNHWIVHFKWVKCMWIISQ